MKCPYVARMRNGREIKGLSCDLLSLCNTSEQYYGKVIELFVFRKYKLNFTHSDLTVCYLAGLEYQLFQ